MSWKTLLRVLPRCKSVIKSYLGIFELFSTSSQTGPLIRPNRLKQDTAWTKLNSCTWSFTNACTLRCMWLELGKGPLLPPRLIQGVNYRFAVKLPEFRLAESAVQYHDSAEVLCQSDAGKPWQTFNFKSSPHRVKHSASRRWYVCRHELAGSAAG